MFRVVSREFVDHNSIPEHTQHDRTIDQSIEQVYKYPSSCRALRNSNQPAMSSAQPHLAFVFRRLVIVLLPAIIVAGCVKRQFPQSQHFASSNSSSAQQIANLRIKINTASADELETLPGIGPGLAARIVEHREKYGPFRRPEHLLIVRGISDKRFRALRELITVE